MANEAHKEPTMEEILASIRKIIADDGPPASGRKPGAEPAAAEPKPMAFDNDDADLGMFEGDEPDFADEVVEEVTEQITGPELSFEAMLGAEKPAETAPKPRPAPEPEPEPAPAPAPRAMRPAPPQPEPASTASPRYTNAPLTDDNTAGAAAGALGKLISKMDLGSDNTLEGLVRELLKPMIKEWLDANLARIVEEKVEAEVQRIARMAR